MPLCLERIKRLPDTVRPWRQYRSRRHIGFNVYCGPAIWSHDEDALKNLAHYMIRAAFSQEKMTYVSKDQSPDRIPKAICQWKDGRASQTFDALDWLAQLTTHIPGKNEPAKIR